MLSPHAAAPQSAKEWLPLGPLWRTRLRGYATSTGEREQDFAILLLHLLILLGLFYFLLANFVSLTHHRTPSRLLRLRSRSRERARGGLPYSHPPEIVHSNHHENGNRLDAGDGENILVCLAMGESADRQHGNDGAIVRERVHSAAGHGCNAMQHAHGDVSRF